MVPLRKHLSELNNLVTAFQSEFVPVDEKRRLKEVLRKRTKHPEENLKQFIYVISSVRMGEPATNMPRKLSGYSDKCTHNSMI